MKLSAKAWELSSNIFEAIIKHPFNSELMKGSLHKDKFAYYIEQDSLYLQDFARSLAIIASKAPIQYIRSFLRFADDTFIAEQEVVHQFFKTTLGFKEIGSFTPATLSYTSYLRNICANESIEIAVAAVLPCFWVYREVGLFISQHSNANNPYARWIEAYASDEFGAAVEEAISIFDALSTEASDATKQRMLDIFYKSTCLEWHFWNDAYDEVIFDGIGIRGDIVSN